MPLPHAHRLHARRRGHEEGRADGEAPEQAHRVHVSIVINLHLIVEVRRDEEAALEVVWERAFGHGVVVSSA